MFYKLYTSCLFQKGTDEGCILNLANNKVFKLSAQEQEIIDSLEEGEKVEKKTEDISPLLNKLTKEGFGEYYEKPIIFEEARLGYPPDVHVVPAEGISVYHINLNLTGECNMNCYYCSDDDQVRKRTGCKKWRIVPEKINFDNYRQLIKQACEFGCMSISILGGEPFLEKELLFQIIEFIRTSTEIKNVRIATNGYLLDDEIISNIKNEILIINIIAHNDQVLNRIDRNKNSLDILTNNLEKLRNSNIGYRFHLVISKENYKNINNILEFYKNYNSRGYTFDYIYDESDENYLGYYLQQIGNEYRNKMDLFQINNHRGFHPCLNGILSLFPDGTISVCPMMKGEPVGNVKKYVLNDILMNGAMKYWKMPLSSLEKCQGCSYRFLCRDCRAIEKTISGDLYKKVICPKEYI
jgi:radical SAM protein with 4Fe4S-binding SPASM domain